MKQLNIGIEDKMHQDLKVLAAKTSKTVKKIVNDVLQNYINQLTDGGVD